MVLVLLVVHLVLLVLLVLVLLVRLVLLVLQVLLVYLLLLVLLGTAGMPGATDTAGTAGTPGTVGTPGITGTPGTTDTPCAADTTSTAGTPGTAGTVVLIVAAGQHTVHFSLCYNVMLLWKILTCCSTVLKSTELPYILKVKVNYACCLPWPIMQALCYLTHTPIGSITDILEYRADCNSKFS